MVSLSTLLVYISTLVNSNSLVHAISGGLGSALAITVCFPLDTVRTRLQVDSKRKARYSHHVIREILLEEGTYALYRGWFSAVVSLFVTNFVYFLFFHGCRNLLASNRGNFAFLVDSGIVLDLIIGVGAGCITVIVTNPLWVVNTRLKLQGMKMKTEQSVNRSRKYDGIIDCMYGIMRTEGTVALWAGVGTSLVLVTNPAIQFMAYETIKRNFERFVDAKNFGGIVYFLYGAAAKLVATLVTYPLQVFQTRNQAGIPNEKHIQNIPLLQRIGNYYRGLESKILQTVLTASLMFFIYEHIVNSIHNILNI